MAGDEQGGGEKDWQKKAREFEKVKARAKALRLRLTCTICGEKAKLNCPCGTTQYCSTDCQKIDWRNRGHRKACKKIRDERAAEAARAEAPTPPPSPPKPVVYGPAPRSHADEVRARIAAEHEAARARREANPERAPMSARFGSRCPICLEEWDVNDLPLLMICCCRTICTQCVEKFQNEACPLCRAPCAETRAENLARLRRHVENEIPEAMNRLGLAYHQGQLGLVQNLKKAAKCYKRAVELRNVDASHNLAVLYTEGAGVTQNKKKAMQLFRMAADRGCLKAQVNYATCLCQDGIDSEASVRYMKMAADRGFTPAEFNVGVMLINSKPGEANLDKKEGMIYLAKASQKGHKEAKAALEQCFEHIKSGVFTCYKKK